MHGLLSRASTLFIHEHVLGRRQLTYVVSSTSRKLVFLLNSRSFLFRATRLLSKNEPTLLRTYGVNLQSSLNVLHSATWVECDLPTGVGLGYGILFRGSALSGEEREMTRAQHPDDTSVASFTLNPFSCHMILQGDPPSEASML